MLSPDGIREVRDRTMRVRAALRGLRRLQRETGACSDELEAALMEIRRGEQRPCPVCARQGAAW